MEAVVIKILGSYLISNGKLAIDNNLFFDLEKVSFVSEEFIHEDINNDLKTYSFFFKFVVDGVLYQVIDSNVFNSYDNSELQLSLNYSEINVFNLRKSIIEVVF